jgi:hypothetical protein
MSWPGHVRRLTDFTTGLWRPGRALSAAAFAQTFHRGRFRSWRCRGPASESRRRRSRRRPTGAAHPQRLHPAEVPAYDYARSPTGRPRTACRGRRRVGSGWRAAAVFADMLRDRLLLWTFHRRPIDYSQGWCCTRIARAGAPGWWAPPTSSTCSTTGSIPPSPTTSASSASPARSCFRSTATSGWTWSSPWAASAATASPTSTPSSTSPAAASRRGATRRRTTPAPPIGRP